MSFKVVSVDKRFQIIDEDKERLEKEGGIYITLDKEKPTEEEIIDACKDAEIIISVYSKITKKIIDNAKKCKMLIRTGIGVDNIDVEAATKKGIPVANVPDYCLDEVSDHAVSLALILSRQILILNEDVKKGKWDESKDNIQILAMKGQKFGLLGIGKISQRVVKKIKPFGFEIITYDPYVDKNIAKDLGVEMVSLERLFKESDFISLHAPLTEETKHIVNKNTLKLMKPTAYLINTARGPLINEKDLYIALKEKWIAGAGIDVTEIEPLPFDSPLLTLNNIIITPHVAFLSEKSFPNLRKRVIDEAIRVGLGNKPVNWFNKKQMEKDLKNE